MDLMDLSKGFYLLILVYALIVLMANFIFPQRFPKIPGDIFIDRSGFRLYIPLASPLVITIITYYLLRSLLM